MDGWHGVINHGATATGIGPLDQFGNGAARYFFAQEPAFDRLGVDPARFHARVQQVSE